MTCGTGCLTSAVSPHDPVDNRESLYRLVKPIYVKPENGGWHLSSQAFTHPSYRISVDRAALCGNDPAHTQVEESDFVCSVVAGAVRNITFVHKPPTGEIEYSGRVDATPQPENRAHADIYVHPRATKGAFRKLQERLAQLARWENGFGPDDA